MNMSHSECGGGTDMTKSNSLPDDKHRESKVGPAAEAFTVIPATASSNPLRWGLIFPRDKTGAGTYSCDVGSESTSSPLPGQASYYNTCRHLQRDKHLVWFFIGIHLIGFLEPVSSSVNRGNNFDAERGPVSPW